MAGTLAMAQLWPRLPTWGQCYTNYFSFVNDGMVKQAKMFVKDKPLPPILMFASKARSLPLSGVTRIGYSLDQGLVLYNNFQNNITL